MKDHLLGFDESGLYNLFVIVSLGFDEVVDRNASLSEINFVSIAA